MIHLDIIEQINTERKNFPSPCNLRSSDGASGLWCLGICLVSLRMAQPLEPEGRKFTLRLW